MLETITHSRFDSENLNSIENRFLDRIERRTRFLKQLKKAGLGIYLSVNDDQRKNTVESLVLQCTRDEEIARLRPEIMRRAALIMHSHLETMQTVLPYDVQYRNRMRQKVW